MIATTCFPTIIPAQKRTLPARQKKCPDTPVHLTQPRKQKKKAQITGQFMTTSLPNFPLTYLAAPPQQHYLHAGKKTKPNKPENCKYTPHKTLMNY